MPHYTYLIVGGGMTADAAIDGIREVDRERLHRPDRQPSHIRPTTARPCPKGSGKANLWRASGARPTAKG